MHCEKKLDMTYFIYTDGFTPIVFTSLQNAAAFRKTLFARHKKRRPRLPTGPSFGAAFYRLFLQNKFDAAVFPILIFIAPIGDELSTALSFGCETGRAYAFIDEI